MVALLLLALLAGVADSELVWRPCKGCGRNSAANAQCEEFFVGELGEPAEFIPGASISVDTSIFASLYPASTFYEDTEKEVWDWTQHDRLSYTVGLLRTVKVAEEEKWQMFFYDQHMASEVSGSLTTFAPALATIDGQSVIQVTLNIDPPEPIFSFTNNYGSPVDHRLHICADIVVITEAEDFISAASWKSLPWSPCVGDASCSVGTRTRTVRCDHAAAIEDDGARFLTDEHCEAKGAKPATAESCTPLACTGTDVLWSTWASTIQVGDSVEVPAGVTLTLDASPVRLNQLVVKGAVTVKQGADITLEVDSLRVAGGTFSAGTIAEPFTGSLDIVLGQNYADPPPLGEHSTPNSELKSIVVLQGGVLRLTGTQAESWLRLGENAAAGTSTIVTEAATGWAVGDEIVVVSSEFYDINKANRATKPMDERRTITAISGTSITLSAALAWGHYGELQTFAGRAVDERSEVIRLTRNIHVRGTTPDVTLDAAFGGHVAAIYDATMTLTNVEFSQLGQAGRLGRYPVHFHRLEDAGANSFVKNCSIHNTFQRSVTIHNTNKVVLEHTSTFAATGHAIFWEDGTEVETVVHNCIVAGTQPQAVSDWREDVHDAVPSAFWLTNFNQFLTNNVAATSHRGVGFWYKVNNHGNEELVSHPQAMVSALGSFEDNVAHGNQFSGLWLWHDWRPCFTYYQTFAHKGDTTLQHVGATSSDCRFPGEGCGEYTFREQNPAFGDCAANGGVQTMKRFTSFKHRDIGTAVYFSTTNLHVEDFTSVTETTGAAFVQMWRDQTGADALSAVDYQHNSGFVIVGTSANNLNGAYWCQEAVSRGLLSSAVAGGCTSGCHPWPLTRGHPSGFADNKPAFGEAVEDPFALPENRYLAGFIVSNEGGVGSHSFSDFKFVNYQADAACGVDKVKPIAEKLGNQKFQTARVRIEKLDMYDSAGTKESGVTADRVWPAESNLCSSGEATFLGADVGSIGATYAKGMYVICGDDSMHVAGCTKQTTGDEVLVEHCDAQKAWFTGFALNFTGLWKAYVAAGKPEAGLECTANFERLVTRAGFGAHLHSQPEYFLYRLPVAAVVGGQYKVALSSCLEALVGEPSYIEWEKLNYNPITDPAREITVILELPETYTATVSWFADRIGGSYGAIGSGHHDDVAKEDLATLPQYTSGTVETACCGGKSYVRMVLGEQLCSDKTTGGDSGIKFVVQTQSAPASCATDCATEDGPWEDDTADRIAAVAAARVSGAAREKPACVEDVSSESPTTRPTGTPTGTPSTASPSATPTTRSPLAAGVTQSPTTTPTGTPTTTSPKHIPTGTPTGTPTVAVEDSSSESPTVAVENISDFSSASPTTGSISSAGRAQIAIWMAAWIGAVFAS